MIYKEKTLDTMSQILDCALQIAKNGNQSEADEFLKEYAKAIQQENGTDYEQSIEAAKTNLGYFSGYYNDDIRNLIKETYDAKHPILNYDTEDYVSFEVAKLLKSKGFDEKVRAFYNDRTHKLQLMDAVIDNEKPFNLCLLAPTHQMALKWLRENSPFVNIIIKHNNKNKYFGVIEEMNTGMMLHLFDSCDNYEDAVEVAIKYCLTEIL